MTSGHSLVKVCMAIEVEVVDDSKGERSCIDIVLCRNRGCNALILSIQLHTEVFRYAQVDSSARRKDVACGVCVEQCERRIRIAAMTIIKDAAAKQEISIRLNMTEVARDSCPDQRILLT